MSSLLKSLLLTLSCFAGMAAHAVPDPSSPKGHAGAGKPNIVFMFADDSGWGELSATLCASRPGWADDRSVLHYDHPIAKNLKRLDHSVPRSQINARFMAQALPLGNGRFGAMFSGHVDSEYLVFNDITLWMNSTRGESEFKQSGSPADGKDYLELVRAACREGKYRHREGSIESLGTKYLASKQRLGELRAVCRS